ncbi:MAG: GNAT family N-acetyltransferase [Solirubrobacteraceae bacterium]
MRRRWRRCSMMLGFTCSPVGVRGTLEDLRVRYARQVVGRSPDGRQRWLNWVARQRSDGAAVGIIQATVTDDDRTAELAWTIAVAFQRRGYARKAACSQSELLMRQSFPSSCAERSLSPTRSPTRSASGPLRMQSSTSGGLTNLTG